MPRTTDSHSTPVEATKDPVGRFAILASALCIAAALVAWHNSFTGPFVFDDLISIVRNASLRHWSTALFPPGDSGATVSGRPVLNLSLAINHALGGLDVRGYHVGNLLLHVAAGLVLLGLVRRLLPLADERFRTQPRATVALAGAVALLWTVHPLQTESVTYIVQRAEILAGLFYLLTVYAFVRSAETGTSNAGRWRTLSVAACFLGVASKEVVATAPLFVLLLDRTWLAGTFREAWRQRRGYYLALFASWLLLAAFVAWAGRRGDTAGLGLTITPWAYLLTQAEAIVLYLQLTFWPHPLVLDYGNTTVSGILVVLPQIALILLLLGGTVAMLARRAWTGLVGAWFFLVLGPSSSFVPVATQTMAEHRMYLPLAAVVVLVAVGVFRVARHRFAFFAPAVVILATALAATTIARNHDYRTAESIWRDNLAKVPTNPRAYEGLGVALQHEHRLNEARNAFQSAIRMGSNTTAVHGALGTVLFEEGRLEDARRQFEIVLKIDPRNPHGHSSLGNVLLALGQGGEALVHQQLAVEIDPRTADFRYNLANTLFLAERFDEAIEHYRAALWLDRTMIEARFNLANALALSGRLADAETEFRAVVAERPDLADAWCNLGDTLVQLGRKAEARSAYEQALTREAQHAAAREGLRRLTNGR